MDTERIGSGKRTPDPGPDDEQPRGFWLLGPGPTAKWSSVFFRVTQCVPWLKSPCLSRMLKNLAPDERGDTRIMRGMIEATKN